MTRSVGVTWPEHRVCVGIHGSLTYDQQSPSCNMLPPIKRGGMQQPECSNWVQIVQSKIATLGAAEQFTVEVPHATWAVTDKNGYDCSYYNERPLSTVPGGLCLLHLFTLPACACKHVCLPGYNMLSTMHPWGGVQGMSCCPAELQRHQVFFFVLLGV